MGAVGKLINKPVDLIGKGIGTLTGTTGQQRAAEEQAEQMRQQQQQQAMQAAAAARDAATQSQQRQSTIESQQARDKAVADAKDRQKQAHQTDNQQVDVAVGGDDGMFDSEGRRIRTRDQFFSNKNTKSGINL